MADEVDNANDVVELAISTGVKNARAAKPEAVYTGRCLECGEPTGQGFRWCDAECRDAWELSQHRMRCAE